MVEPREKLRRARILFGFSQDKCDEVSLGVKNGRAHSYERGRAIPTREYLKPLAELWKIPMEWFFDGEDTPPPIEGMVSTAELVAARSEVPVMGHLPSTDCRGSRIDALPVRTSFTLPEGAQYRRITERDKEPFLMRGDMVLVIPLDLPRADTLAMVEYDSFCDVADLQRKGSVIEPLPVTPEHQLPEGAVPNIRGIIVELRRQLSGGLRIVLENEDGLSKEMLQAVPR